MQPIRTEVALPATGGSLRVLLIVEPTTTMTMTPTSGRHAITLDKTGLAALSAASPAMRDADAVVVEIDPAEPDALARFERFIHDHAGHRHVIAAVRDLTVTATRLALRAGAADVLPLLFTPAELADALVPTGIRPRTGVAAPPQPRGKVIAFVGAIGGCGTTSLAAQAGIIWAATTRVCLIDLDVQFGNAALYLDLNSDLSLADVLDAGSRLDVDLLRTIAQTHSSGLSVVASPKEILPLDTFSTDNIDKMLALAAQAFDIVLIDLPGAWTTWSMRVVEVADLTLMVTSLTVPGIHQARRQSEIITANGYTERLRVVVNRVVHPMFGKIDLGETQSQLGRRIDYTIANDYPTVSAAIDSGKPFAAIKSKSRVEKDLRAMVSTLAAALRTEPVV